MDLESSDILKDKAWEGGAREVDVDVVPGSVFCEKLDVKKTLGASEANRHEAGEVSETCGRENEKAKQVAMADDLRSFCFLCRFTSSTGFSFCVLRDHHY